MIGWALVVLVWAFVIVWIAVGILFVAALVVSFAKTLREPHPKKVISERRQANRWQFK